MTEADVMLDPRISDSPTALRILDVAAQLFMQRGYRAVSINDILQAAGVTKPTLYYYFKDKEELFVQMGLRVLVAMSQPLTGLATADWPIDERLRAMARVLVTGYEGDMRMMRHEMMEHLNESARSRLNAAFYHHLFMPLMHVMRDAVAHGLIRISPEMATMLFLNLCETFHELTPPHPMAEWVGPVSPNLLVELFLYGVSTRGIPHPLEGVKE